MPPAVAPSAPLPTPPAEQIVLPDVPPRPGLRPDAPPLDAPPPHNQPPHAPPPAPAGDRFALYAELRALSLTPHCGSHLAIGCRRC